MTAFTLRIVINCLLVGFVSLITSFQLLLQDGKLPSQLQMWSAIAGASLLMLNDIKSRLTPTQLVEATIAEATKVVVAATVIEAVGAEKPKVTLQ